MKTHIFSPAHKQGYLSNPPNAHLKVEKSRRNGKAKRSKKSSILDAAEYLWFDTTFPLHTASIPLWSS